MRHLLSLILLLCCAAALAAEDLPGPIRPAGDAVLGDFKWHHRPIVVFADSPEDPLFAEQIEELTRNIAALEERDVVVLTDTAPDARSPLRRTLRPRGFVLVLIDKEGHVTLRKPLPWTVREITRSIDKMPNRQREIRERRGEG